MPDGKKVEVAEVIVQDSCEGCILKEMGAHLCANSPCLPEERTDRKDIIYKEIKE